MEYNNINNTNSKLNKDLSGIYELIYKKNNTIASNKWEYHTFVKQLSPTIPKQKINIIYLRSNGLDKIVNNFIEDNISNSRNPNIRAILIGEDIIVIGIKINEANEIVHMRFGYYEY